MTLAANRVRIQQHGDTIIGEQTQLLYDQETGLMGQKKTVVADLPAEGGGRHVVVQEEVKVHQLHDPPAYTPPRRNQQALEYNPPADQSRFTIASCLWLLCGCFIFFVSLAMIIPIAAVGLVTCPPSESIGITGIILGVITLLMSCVCCARCLKTESIFAHGACCLTIAALVLVFFSTLIPNTVFVAQKNSDQEIHYECYNAPVMSVGVAVLGMSYGLLLLFGTFCLCTACQCINKHLGH